MANEKTKPPPPQQHVPPARRIRVERTGSNRYLVLEDAFACPPTSTRVLARDLARVPAEDEVRLWLENFLGPNRFGESGL